MNIQLSQKITQTLAMTQQMEQAIKILEMDTLDLREYIQSLSMENPAVDLEADTQRQSAEELRKKKLEWLDTLTKNDTQNVGYYDSSESENLLEKVVAAPDFDTLESYLLDQASWTCSDALCPVVNYVVGYLDEDGYLRATMEELLESKRFSQGQIEEAIAAIQAMEPAGVGARDLSQCLLLQLPPEDTVAREIAANHLDTLAKGRLPHLAKELGVSKEVVEQAFQRIRRLNPKPGSGFGSNTPPQYVIPDVVVTSFQDRYYVLPCEFSYPTINLSQSYIDLMRQSGDKEVEEYIDKKVRQVQWVQKCIASRTETLLNVAKAIVQYQERFFRHGPQYMGVLRMNDIARDLGVHESTVSRAVKNKYLQCSHGTFPLKHFFVQGVKCADGSEGASSHALKCLIRQMIDQEDKSCPLSDQKLADLLGEQGHQISRRTVAKYREQMEIAKSCYRSR